MDNSKEITLTAEGRQKLVDELAYREGELRDEIVERLKEARSFGDLSENSEYDAAKEEQSQNESKIAEIRQTLSVARVVEDAQHGGIRVSIGTTVELEDERGKKTKFTIVGTRPTRSSTRSRTSPPLARPLSAAARATKWSSPRPRARPRATRS